nr:hypothetical protein [Altererythrobacter segetis]
MTDNELLHDWTAEPRRRRLRGTLSIRTRKADDHNSEDAPAEGGEHV